MLTRHTVSRRIQSLCLLCASLALPFLSGVPLRADINYVTNGGFETGATNGQLSPTIPGDLIYVFGVGGATDIGGWTVSSSSINNGSSTPLSVLVVGNPPQIPASGNYAVDFDPFWKISTGALLGPTVTGTLPQISQSFTLPAGNYVLSFDGATEQSAATLQNRPLTVTLTGAASLDETVTTDKPDDVGYTLYSFGFSSTGGAVDLTFTPNDFSPLPNFMLDNVSVMATPEPSQVLPMVLGMLALAGAMWRQRTHARRRQRLA